MKAKKKKKLLGIYFGFDTMLENKESSYFLKK